MRWHLPRRQSTLPQRLIPRVLIHIFEMAEVLGVIGVALQLTRTTKRLYDFARSIEGAPAELTKLAQESNIFSCLFIKFQEITCNQEANSDAATRSDNDQRLIEAMEAQCKEVCNGLRRLVRKCKRDIRRRKAGEESFGTKLQDLYARLRLYFEQSTVRTLKAAVESAKSSLSLFQIMDQYSRVLKELEALRQERRQIPEALEQRM